MDPQTVNSFLDQFLALLDSGFGLIEGDVRYVLNALIVISITLAGAQWALAGEAPMAPFFRKVLFVGLFAFLINNWMSLAGAINESGAALGLRAGGSSMSMADLHDPGRVAAIGVELFGRTAALGEGMDLLSDAIALFTIYLSALLVMLGFFILALQLFVSLIAFKLGALAAFVALPWGVFSGTAWVAERPLGWVVGSAMRLFVLALIASISISFVETLPMAFTLDAGGVLNILLFGLTVMALGWFGPVLAAEIVQGQPQLAGADAMRAGQGALITGAVAGLAGARAVQAMGRALGGSPRGASGLPPGRRAGAAARAAPLLQINYARMQPPTPNPNTPK
ncbi:MAG TPA: P-type conjugative transfer protein TrbL, partial [Verrucomicrobiae bacterium]|nr:P-type conjugative transfer protein TrbL [Verrucomicrobiae bacterium]